MNIKKLLHHLGNYFTHSPFAGQRTNSPISSSPSPISHFPIPKPHSAFTIVEILIIAPIVILVIGVFVSAIVSMTGEVLATRAANALAYKTQDALNLIQQDVKLSGAYLATNNISLVSPQGYNDDTTNFHNADATNGTMLILNAYATTSNPLVATRGLVYASGQPNLCNSAQVNQNIPVMMNIIYFVKNNTLWRRVIMPSTYATVGCSVPWQQPSCVPGYNPTTYPFCKTQDMRLVDGIASGGFSVSYYPTSSSTTANATASNSALSDSARQTALLANSTVGVTITAANTTAGRDISQSGIIRAVSPNNNIMSDIYTKLLLHTDGTDTSTTFTDNGLTPKTVTAVGNAQIDTAQSKFGGASGLFDGTGDYLSLVDSEDWNFGNGDFTIDMWVRRNNDTSGNPLLIGQSTSAGTQRSWEILFLSNNTLVGRFFHTGGTNVEAISATPTTADGIFHHIAFVRYGNSTTIYRDGVAGATIGNVTGKTIDNSTATLSIGRLGEYTGDNFNGWIDEVRVSKGIVRWTTNFTPPTQPYSS